ncbi:MAG: DEAD/DEAH box helicase family protein [Planctomycetia bacterium]|nr:DEAD/DEAH box helicase family protein [Planctomycetia bacterium]
MVDKKQLSEEDIKRLFITPALVAKGWNDKIKMEESVMEQAVKVTDGKINISGNKVFRDKPLRADYILYYITNYPIAIVEAKDNNHSVSYGIQQAKTYAKKMHIPFAYSSNGDAFQEYDFLTGKERQIALADFPTPEELFERYRLEANNGAGLSEDEIRIINQPYCSGQNINDPRYYQRNAINGTVDAIARGQKRILLVMATGTGKTFTAFQIVYRLLKSGLKRKILYLADRNILVDQSIQQDFAPLKGTTHKIDFSKDDPTLISSYEVFFSLYQQLSGKAESDDTEEDGEEAITKFQALFSPDFFDLVIVDECHRGSAKKDSSWRKILEYFSQATQIGMTATPKETRYISNIDYFGEPVYTYSLNDGINDGYLAPFKVINITTDVGDGWRPYKGQRDVNGQEIEDRIYNNSDYDYRIVLEDRINQVAAEITNYLKSTDRMAKTIVFCATEEHAERMRVALVNLNADMCRENPDYVVRITGSDPYGKSKLDYFISVTAQYPVIATTSKLLSTGVDCKMTKLIVLDQMIGSMTEFKQIIGRGTRIREKEGKTHFVVMDFRAVSRLFADPKWDGDVKIDDSFDPNRTPKKPVSTVDPDPDPTPTPQEKPFVDVDGCPVRIINKKVSVYDPDGKLLRQESVIDYTKRNIRGEYASLDRFISDWSARDKKQEIVELFQEHGIDLQALKDERNMSDVDDFDFICHVAYDQKPLTRRERADNVKKRDFFSKYSGVARAVLEALLDRYMDSGVYEIEKTTILKLDPFSKFGAPAKIVSYFGGSDGYRLAVQELMQELYRVAS